MIQERDLIRLFILKKNLESNKELIKKVIWMIKDEACGKQITEITHFVGLRAKCYFYNS